MIKKREGWKVVIFEPAKSRIANNQCPGCAKPKSEWKRRKDWRCCSVDCTDRFAEMYLALGWPGLRMKAFKRDKFICRHCGKRPNTMQESSWLFEKFKNFVNRIERDYVVYRYTAKTIKWMGEDRMELKFYADIPDASNLIGDHIKPIALGGDEWDIDNVQTLCLGCNKIKTAQDAKDIAKERKRLKLLKNNQTLGTQRVYNSLVPN